MPAMFAFLFTSPAAAMAVLAGAAAIPVLIHLLNRKRHRIVQWAAMRFLLAAQRQHVRRIQLERWLLLAVRILIAVLLVIAMAAVMPWAEPAWQSLLPSRPVSPVSQGRIHRILVIDAGFSMAAHHEEASRFETAKAEAIALLNRASPGEGYSVVVLGPAAQVVVPGPADDPSKVIREIEQLTLAHGGTDVSGGLAMIADMVNRPLGKYTRREVIIFTDLKRSTWSGLAAADKGANPVEETGTGLTVSWRKVVRGSRVVFVDVARQDTDNVAVTQLTPADPLLLAGHETSVTAIVQNFGRTERKNLRVELVVGSSPGMEPVAFRVAGERVVSVPAGQTVSITFDLRESNRLTIPGEYVLQVRAGEDALPLDDARSVVIRVRERIPVLVVDGSASGSSTGEAKDPLLLALHPARSLKTPTPSPAQVTVLTPAQFADAGLSDLSQYDCVFLNDLPSVDGFQAKRLEAFLRKGGSIVMGFGPNAQSPAKIEMLNQLLYADGKGILPAPLEGVRQAEGRNYFALYGDDDTYKKPPLSGFRADYARAALSSQQIYRYLRFKPPEAPNPAGANSRPRPPLTSVARVLLWFIPVREGAAPEANGEPPASDMRDPAVLDYPKHRGRVIIHTSTLGYPRQWSGWPGTMTFLPFIQEVLRYAVSSDTGSTLVAGMPLEVYVPSALAGLSARLLRCEPSGETEVESAQVQALDEGAVVRFSSVGISGIYRITVGKQWDGIYAFNVPVTAAGGGAESDLRRVLPAELQGVPGSEVVVVSDIAEVPVVPALVLDGGEPTEAHEPWGPTVAKYLLMVWAVLLILELFLAWQFGSARSSTRSNGAVRYGRRWAAILGWIFALLGLLFAGIIIHALITDDLLGFLPSSWREPLEREFGVPSAAPGEGTRWKLDAIAYLTGDPRDDRWLTACLIAAAITVVILIYRRERLPDAMPGSSKGPITRLITLRIATILIAGLVLLPQLRLSFEREGWPDVVLLIDDSLSMSTVDTYHDPAMLQKVAGLKLAWARLAQPRIEALEKRIAGIDAQLSGMKPAEGAELREERERLQARLKDLNTPHRLNLLKALIASGSRDWLQNIVGSRQMRIHIYRVSAQAVRITEIHDPAQCPAALEEIIELAPTGDSTQLGDAVLSVLKTFRGGSLNAVIMLTDGITTRGEELPPAARLASRAGVPLYLVGVGDAEESPDLILSDLRAERIVRLNDRLVFEARVAWRGPGKPESVPVVLYEVKDGKPHEVGRENVRLGTSPEKVRIIHQVKETGEKHYILRVDKQSGETDESNNRIEHDVTVTESKQVRVLYIEGRPRYEMRYVKSLFERQVEAGNGARAVALDVYLVGANPDIAKQDASFLANFPSKQELDTYDVVILGDVDPRQFPGGEGGVQLLSDYVRQHGGGLVIIAGEQYTPQAYRDTALADVMPVVYEGGHLPQPPKASDPSITEEFRPELTASGLSHPIFRFNTDEAENAAIWERLMPQLWYSHGYRRKPAAEVLAVHPKQPAEGGAAEKYPLVLQQFVGSGRVLFFGFDEMWRWRFRQDEVHYDQFWGQVVGNLARSRVGKPEARLDRKVYHRGEPIRVTVQFPDDKPAPGEDAKVEVNVERRPLARPEGKSGIDREQQTIVLSPRKTTGSGNAPIRTFEGLLSRTPEGEYAFTYVAPKEWGSKSRVEATVLPPVGELDRLHLNEADLRRAADESHGAYYPLDHADTLPDELPAGVRVALDQPCPPIMIWNHWILFVLALGIPGIEWIVRKRGGLL